MSSPKDLLETSRQWSQTIRARDLEFFARLAQKQAPKYLWIGCLDSRVPVNQIVDLVPGEVFVHRNVANLVVHADLNCLSVMQFAVEVLRVEHIMVVGHYGCDGVQVVLEDRRVGLCDNWLRHVGEVRAMHAWMLERLPDARARHDRLCELNAVQQVVNVCGTPVVPDAWDRGQKLAVHGGCHGLSDGRIHDLGMNVARRDELGDIHERTIAALAGRA